MRCSQCIHACLAVPPWREGSLVILPRCLWVLASLCWKPHPPALRMRDAGEEPPPEAPPQGGTQQEGGASGGSIRPGAGRVRGRRSCLATAARGPWRVPTGVCQPNQALRGDCQPSQAPQGAAQPPRGQLPCCRFFLGSSDPAHPGPAAAVLDHCGCGPSSRSARAVQCQYWCAAVGRPRPRHSSQGEPAAGQRSLQP